MNTCLYIAFWDMHNADGITKKIKSQISALESLFNSCHYVIFSNDEVISNVNDFTSVNYDFVYVRNCNGKGTIKIFNLLYKLKAKRVTYEIPTYPYFGEIRSFFSIFEYCLKKFLIRFFVNDIVYIGHYNRKNIWGVPANEITNAISEPSQAWELTNYSTNDVYDIIGVASQAIWHGYDRLIRGIAISKSSNIRFHIVGDGPVLDELQVLANKLCVTNNVIFHGRLDGDELYKLLSKMDCGIDSLARHRVNVEYNSSLKAKEYLAFGLPVVMSHIDDSIINNKFVLKVESSEAAIDIITMIDFICMFNMKKDEIQTYAYRNFTWKAQFTKILSLGVVD